MSPSVSVRLLLTQSDARLVALAREGHERAFEALVQRYRRPLLSYCRRLLLPSDRAEDALQQGLLQAWMALQSGREVREVRPWLYRIVHNAALNMLRTSGYDYAKLSESLRGADAPQEDLDRRIAIREAFAGLAALPEMQREALLRTALDGHSHEQVARALGLSEGALRGLVYRARATLRAATTALTPSPVVSWALSPRGGASVSLAARVAELGAGSGSVGVGGLLLKGGAVAVTAGALAGAVAAVHHPHRRPHAARISSAAPPVAVAASIERPANDSPGTRLEAVAAGGGAGRRRAHHRTSAPPLPAQIPQPGLTRPHAGLRLGGRLDGHGQGAGVTGRDGGTGSGSGSGGDHTGTHAGDSSGTDGHAISLGGGLSGSGAQDKASGSGSGDSGSGSSSESGSGDMTSTTGSGGSGGSGDTRTLSSEPTGGDALLGEPTGSAPSSTGG